MTHNEERIKKNEEKKNMTKKYVPDLELHGYSDKLTEGENIGKFQCNLCGKINSNRQYSFKHVKGVHFPGSYQYECDKCDEQFCAKKKFVKHSRRVHPSKKHNEEKPKKPSNHDKSQTIVKLGLHLAMEKNDVQRMKVLSANDGDGIEVIWSDYCDTEN